MGVRSMPYAEVEGKPQFAGMGSGGSSGGGSGYTLPVASSSKLGGVKVGSGLSITDNGVLSASGGGSGYTLPVASSSTLGGVKIGSGLSITENGVLSATGGSSSGGITISTTETVIGTYNGQTLYSKIVPCSVSTTLNANSWDMIGNYSGLGTIKSAYLDRVNSDNLTMPVLAYWNPGNDALKVCAFASAKLNANDSKIVLFYTK